VKVTTIILLQLQSLCNTQLTFLTKQPQTYKITSSNINQTVINNTTHCSRNKMLTAANPGTYYFKYVL